MSAKSSTATTAARNITKRIAQHTDPMTTASVTPIIDRNYTYSHSFQWVREATVNSAQAGATCIEFTTEWQAVAAHGVHRRIIIDNGPGIVPEDMALYLNRLGGSGQTVAAKAANYGFGLKTSLLPWNKHGVVLLSRVFDEESNESSTHMMWLHKITSKTDPHGTYGARRFDVRDPNKSAYPDFQNVVNLEDWNHFHTPEDYIDGEHVPNPNAVDWTKVFPAKQKSGFAIVLLGDHAAQDTVTGDPNRDESRKYGLTAYSNARFWEFPITVKTLQYENKSNRDKWPTKPVGSSVVSTDDGGVASRARQNRCGKGLRNAIEVVFGSPSSKFPKRGLDASGSFEIAQSKTQPGAIIHWWLFKEKIQNRGDLPTAPLSGIRHESHPGIHEVYDLAAIGEHTATISAKTRMNQFVQVSSVRDRMAIIVEPIETPQYAIYPEQSRTRLMFESKTSGAQNFTWEEWAEVWRANLPEEIKAAIDSYYDEQAEKSDSTDDLRDLLDFGTPFVDRLQRLVAPYGGIANGSLVGTHSNPRSSARKTANATSTSARKTTPTNPPKGDSTDAKRKKALSLGLIMCTAVNEPDEDFTVSYDDTAKQTVLNLDSPVYRSIVDSIVAEYVNAGRVETDDTSRRTVIADEVRRQSLRHLTLGGSHAVGVASHNPDMAREMLSPYALQAMLYGVRHLETLVAKPLGQRLGGALAATPLKAVTATTKRRAKQATAA